RHARRRLAEAHRHALHLPRPDDRGAARLVAQAADAARPGAEGLAALLRQARRARRGALGARGPARLHLTGGALVARVQAANSAHRRPLHRRALRRAQHAARDRAPAPAGARPATRVKGALATLAFEYAPRAPFCRSELEQYLLLARESDLDVFALRGSYAGAIGLPQFMPRSVRRFGVDFDGDGAIDLRRSSADAIGSVAN